MIIGVVATVVYVVFLFPIGCDGGNAPDWDCSSPLGRPTFSVEDFGLNNALDMNPPILIGLLVGLITWWILGPFRRDESG